MPGPLSLSDRTHGRCEVAVARPRPQTGALVRPQGRGSGGAAELFSFRVSPPRGRNAGGPPPLTTLLGESALFLAVATALLLVAGTRRIPTYVLRLVLWAVVALAIGIATGHVRLRTGVGLPIILPPLTDGWAAVALATGVITMLAPRRWWAIGALALGSLVVASAVYIVYLFDVTLVLSDSPLSIALGLVLFAIEVVALTLMAASVFEMLDALCRPVSVPVAPPATRWPTVAIQVPTHEEPADLVGQTIQRLIALDYPVERLVVQVIDNNTADERLWRPLEEACRRLREQGHRVEFAHVEELEGFKAGALNWGMRRLPDDVELIAVVDSDYLVEPDFLRATVPYFEDPAVAFVQTPQEYRAWQDSAFYRACHTGFAYFFKVGMISRSYRNSIIFAGTMGIVRRGAIEAIGGWDEAVITEDAEASLRMLARGSRGLYVPTPYGRGIMPLTYEGLRKQRFRWAFGGIQILRKHWRSLLPWSASGLDQRQRRDYLLGGLWWFNDALTLGFAAFIAATAIGVLTGRPFVVQRLEGLGLVLPLLYIVLGLVRYLWGLRIATRVSMGEAIAALRVNLSLSWVVTLACARGLIEERGVFLRTPKFAGSATVREFRLVWVETLLGLASAALAIGVFLVAGLSILTLTVDTLLVWSALIYGSATTFALSDPKRPPAALRQKAALELGDSVLGSAPVRGAAVGGFAVVAVALFLALGAESARPPVSGGGLPVPPAAHAITAGLPSSAPPTPTPSPSATAGTPAPTAASPTSSAASPGPSATPGPTATPAAAMPTPAPASPTPPSSVAPSASP